MIIERKDMGVSCLMKAKQGNFEFNQLYSNNIPSDKIDRHFSIEATIKYEQWVEENGKS